MERNEIKLRGKLSASDIHRHRDYNSLMKRHRRSLLFTRTFRFFYYSLIVTFVVLMLILVSWYAVQMKKRPAQRPGDVKTTLVLVKKN